MFKLSKIIDLLKFIVRKIIIYSFFWMFGLGMVLKYYIDYIPNMD